MNANIAPWRFALLVGALAAAVFTRLAWRTITDVDEGYYSIAGELIGSGKTLYRDFFFPQGPLVPYLLGLIWRFVHLSLRGQRVVMALFGGVTAGAIAHAVRKETRSRFAGVLGAAFFVVHEIAWQWVPMVKTYALASCFSLLAVILVTGPTKPSVRRCVAAGILAGLAVSARLLAAPVLPVVVLAAALRETRGSFLRGVVISGIVVAVSCQHDHKVDAVVAVAALIAVSVLFVSAPFWRTLRSAVSVGLGFATAAFPVWLLYRKAPEAFVFGNFGYHAYRNDGGLLSNWESSRNMFYALVGVDKVSTFSVAGPQFLLLGILTAVSLTQRNRQLRVAPALAAVLLVIANLQPNGLHEQYFVVAVPLFALCASMAVGHALQARDQTRVRRYAWPVIVGAAYVVLAYPSWDRKWNLAIYDPSGMRAARPSLVEASAAMVRRTEAEFPGPILPTWPGSALGSGAEILPGFEDHFARQVADKVSPETRAKFHLTRASDLSAAVVERTASIVVLDREAGGGFGDELRKTLEQSGYTSHAKTVAAEIFVRRSSSGSASLPSPR